ncbi:MULTISPECIES: NADH-quinone oxidoreductase subunit J [Acidiplasma]|jgi:NADH-quinone oxidoreductase subunit J|uniref:NADH dehydrogenase n=2 Tax=Acidiplasma TaxID=507753 RepID=A0A0Q0RI62_9ARCH|nr:MULTISPECIES: NADH-quinone oxidoreductase subunit J [Acidiplasma]KJE49709.1 NADH dehydrogenase [Acidiplasma sp. MBA-1]KPV45952.1 NADH dehydrogenase [Acidiplasma aeolicum]KQB34153.1 NADH dehydrogenase [Acidiplasma aeolicum]KQB35035.1 NADH dehydrogenase [Acidiplasma cupricumulans]WMT55650.1 MAG: NADH-quinone oxidoreductase subunit J [Acidiplasma sp.]
MIYTLIFLILAAIAVIFAAASVRTNNLTHSTIYLLMFLLDLAAMFILLGLSFIGAVEILVYAGAVIILIVFVLMLTGGYENEE